MEQKRRKITDVTEWRASNQRKETEEKTDGGKKEERGKWRKERREK